MLGKNIVYKLFDMYAAGKLAPDDYYELLELLDEAFQRRKEEAVA
jgi:hypothetical protein